MQHTARIPYFQLAPKSAKALTAFALQVRKDLLGERLVELVNLRLSQINGCAFCIDMHWNILLRGGMAARHINALPAWREAPFFSARECAALRWAELVNAMPQADASDAAFADLQAQFSDEEIAELSMAIVAIRAWNLLNVSLRNPLPEQPFVA
jgi:AhpD family alkylhydroperoxidase